MQTPCLQFQHNVNLGLPQVRQGRWFRFQPLHGWILGLGRHTSSPLCHAVLVSSCVRLD